MTLKKTLLLLIILMLLFGWLGTQEKEKNKNQLVEKMKITHTVIPVRVYKGDMIVGGLKKTDFKLYENGIQKAIKTFVVDKKRLKVSRDQKEKRLFILTFKITELNQKIRDGLSYIFNHVLRDGDEVILLANRVAKQFFVKDNADQLYSEIYQIIKADSMQEQALAYTFIREIDDMIKGFRRRVQTNENLNSTPMVRFLTKYIERWTLYKKRYLFRDWKVYANLAKFIQGERKKVWIFDFFQIESFPRLNSHGFIRRRIEQRIARFESDRGLNHQNFARSLRRQLRRLEVEMSVPDTMLLDDAIPLFSSLNATFYSFFIPTSKRRISRDINYKNITSNIEIALKKMTRATGGDVILSANILESVKKIEEMEDIIYILSYISDEKQKSSKIKVKVGNADYKLIYHEKRKPDFVKNYLAKLSKQLPVLQIDGARFVEKMLQFTITGIMIKNKEQQGSVGVSIKGLNDMTKKYIFSAGKALKTRKSKDNIFIRLSFKTLPAGDYTFTIRAKDLTTARTQTKMIKVSFSK